MLFVKTNDLKAGMRLARPVYNRHGVLLYERDSKLSVSAINSIRNFGLLGIYVLEPAEPVPPMTAEDVEFERFQTMMAFSIAEELNGILLTGKAEKMQSIAAVIIKNYAYLDKKINFIQNLRSREDYTQKHSLNVAILCAMLTRAMNIRQEEQLQTIIAAVVHDIGKLRVNRDVADCDELTDEKRARLTAAEISGYDMIERTFSEGTAIRRICAQSQKILEDCIRQNQDTQAMKMVTGSKILAVAGTYDSLTAMQLGKPPVSEIKALKYLMEQSEYYDPQVVRAMVKVINILVPGISVELTNGSKALVITENKENFLRPVVLDFKDNKVLDLSVPTVYKKVQIEDIMRTMDNRHIMDTATLRTYGFKVEEPEYI